MLGAGDLLGGVVVGQIRDRFGNKVTIIYNIILIIPSFIIILIVNNTNTYNYTSWLMCFMWGFMDSGVGILLYSMLGFEFES